MKGGSVRTMDTVYVLILCLLVLTVAGCQSSGSDNDPNHVSVSGTVYDTYNNPVEGAQVKITSDPVIVNTDSQGYFNAKVMPGNHTISITKWYMNIYTAEITCTEDAPMDLGNISTSYDPEDAATDDDGDGYSEDQFDCDDTDPDINPEATENCDDNVDNDCDGDKDCQDSDCDGDSVCIGVDPEKIKLQWLTRTEPVTKFKYSGGIIVKMIFYHNFLITGGAGSIQLKASMEEYDEPNILDERTSSFSVQNNKIYEVIIEVDVSGWGSCNPGFTHSMVFSSPSSFTTSQVDLYSLIDTDTNWFECASSYSISDMNIKPYGTIGSPVTGAWTGTGGFGELDFNISSDATAIEEVKLNFLDFSCGNIVSASGSITFSNNPGWSVTDGEFSIQLTLSQTLDQEMLIQGTFESSGTTATGSYEADFNDTKCSGIWDAAPVTK